ncbi:SIR2 family protein [Sphingosinicella sp. BN140058]|uniref:P-loop NTPase n=1 Tax=Sphingosinicella sp. BN140058 TaxID=1892855 RepID=UPI001011D971|nr:SIR2 family protein [Sphingosinicella sp. BN140058]QAY75217.1 hypothetical protein ETR14_00725 [Sphingosinicella sp. BN140058]
MIKIPEAGLFNADVRKGINLFLGAGFSTLAKNSQGDTLPVGDSLKGKLIAEFKLDTYSALDLPSLYAILLADRRDALRDFLVKTYTVSEYDTKYDSLRRLNVEYLYTTNIDDLPFYIFDGRGNLESRVLHDVYLYGAPRKPASVVQYIPLHGSIKHEDSDFLFTGGQMSSAFASDRETWYVFQRELQARPTVFLGYGMRDAGVLQALHGSSGRAQVNRWILLRREDEATSALYASLGFHVFFGEIEQFLDFIGGQDISRVAISGGRAVHFTGEVPLVAQVAQRPIRNFFLGAEPEWSDAFSSQVVHRRTNSAVKNSIFSGRHVAVVGLPLSGKTTILKQVAAELASDRTVLYFDRLTEPTANQIISEHAPVGDRVLVFVDNLLDSRESVERLVEEINAQIVCAEDSLYFDSVSLRLMAGKIDVISSSEIAAQDLQSIIDSIPAEVRRWHVDDVSEVEADAGEIGLFESFRRHVFDEGLTTRFRAKLAEFESRDPEAFSVYIMACYVARCRSIVSFDMIYMFIDNAKKVYGDVYEITERIGSFLAEVDLVDDPHQDYFSVRSGALARIALKECPGRAFARVYERFHAAVPPRVIVDYPTFRRYAYDNDFARRAYPRVGDGLKFYERLVKSTDNAYDYQHGAIYLSKMKSFTDAFSWIDTAMSKTRGRVYSIRNTHARILFEANIDVVKRDPDDGTALDGIRESMEVLQTCIEKDKRRSYHLLRYSDQAIQFAKVIEDRQSYQWLVHAGERLEEMVQQAAVLRSRESYNLRKYRNLLNDVRSMLAGRGSP